jgi:cysteine desulfurase/selenocysteine lyase
MLVDSPTRQEPQVAFDVENVRRDFPILARKVYDKPLAYLDNAASAQKPDAVIEAVEDTYRYCYSNVHRGVHYLSAEATVAYEGARRKLWPFIGASDLSEVVFVRGTTEAINLVAQSFVRPRIEAGDEILITAMEHHSNIVPWQLLCEQTGAVLKVAPIDLDGEVVVDEFERLLSERTRIAAFTHISNALGTVNPVERMIAMARERGVPTLIDGAQAVPRQRVYLSALGCDFYAFSGHKMFAPTGIGVLYGRAELLREMPPYQGGGEMIRNVTFERTEYAPPPARFEAGTPNIVGAIGLGAAVDYLDALDMEGAARHEAELLAVATEALSAIEGVRLIGTARRKAAVISFVVEGVHAHDVGTILDREGVAIRVGHHCAQPVMDHFGVAATARASFAFYNTRDEVDRLVSGIARVQEVFG